MVELPPVSALPSADPASSEDSASVPYPVTFGDVVGTAAEVVADATGVGATVLAAAAAADVDPYPAAAGVAVSAAANVEVDPYPPADGVAVSAAADVGITLADTVGATTLGETAGATDEKAGEEVGVTTAAAFVLDVGMFPYVSSPAFVVGVTEAAALVVDVFTGVVVVEVVVGFTTAAEVVVVPLP